MSKEDFVRINDRIRIPKIRLIDENGNNVGLIDTFEAKSRARAAGLDLVEVAPNSKPPVCRIMDYGKFRYEQQKKKKKQTNTSKIKEIKFGPAIGEADLQTKIKHATEFLEDGLKVQLTLCFKKRQNAHKEIGFDVMKKFVDSLYSSGVCSVVAPPKLEGKNIRCKLEPVVRQDNEK